MNYRALSVDELAARCAFDADARAFAGEHFAALVNRAEDEWEEQRLATYDDDVNRAALAIAGDIVTGWGEPWRELPTGSAYWRIG